MSVHASRAASLYRAASANPRSAADAQFLSDEAVRQCKILAAFELADPGNSLLAPLLGNVRTAATLASEIVLHPKGGLRDGMLLRAQSPPSKADAGGMVWDGKYM